MEMTDTTSSVKHANDHVLIYPEVQYNNSVEAIKTCPESNFICFQESATDISDSEQRTYFNTSPHLFSCIKEEFPTGSSSFMPSEMYEENLDRTSLTYASKTKSTDSKLCTVSRSSEMRLVKSEKTYSLNEVSYDVSEVVISHQNQSDDNTLEENNLRSKASCFVCYKVFPSPSHLNVHFRSHTGERPYTCNVCQKSFSQIGNLKTHQLIHDKIKPFTCHICTKKFTQAGNLRTHRLTHTADKPFSCDICHKKFSVKKSLKQHQLTHYDSSHNTSSKTSAISYPCSESGLLFNTTSSNKILDSAEIEPFSHTQVILNTSGTNVVE